ncbi:MAG: T9SS type A sorting domain-containing protein, partial [Candidatus Kapabacteria bacterium]|nr:T9SS type A sorting domain-containing protein [Candidatus Kapabacteria bacterium]
PPASFLVSPTQKVFTSTSTDSLIIFSASKSVNDVDLWVLKNPEMGQWKVGVVGKKNGDSVHIWSLVKQRADFTFSAVQIARTVNCNWDNSGASDESFVDFYLDKDNKGYDGYRIGTVNEKTGSFSYTLSDSLMECGYYIYAVRWDNKQATNFVYSPNSFVNNKKILPPPSNATGFYTDKGIVKLRWNKSPDPLSAFYVIKVTDENGKDSLYATVSSIETEAELIVQSPSTKSFSIQTIGLNNTSGCWVKFSNLMLGIDEEKGAWLSTENPIVVIPNPASTQATIHFTLQHDAQTRVVLVNTLGQIVTELTNSVLQQGMHSVQCSTALISDGMYFVRVITPQEQFSTPMTVVR